MIVLGCIFLGATKIDELKPHPSSEQYNVSRAGSAGHIRIVTPTASRTRKLGQGPWEGAERHARRSDRRNGSPSHRVRALSLP